MTAFSAHAAGRPSTSFDRARARHALSSPRRQEYQGRQRPRGPRRRPRRGPCSPCGRRIGSARVPVVRNLVVAVAGARSSRRRRGLGARRRPSPRTRLGPTGALAGARASTCVEIKYQADQSRVGFHAGVDRSAAASSTEYPPSASASALCATSASTTTAASTRRSAAVGRERTGTPNDDTSRSRRRPSGSARARRRARVTACARPFPPPETIARRRRRAAPEAT